MRKKYGYLDLVPCWISKIRQSIKYVPIIGRPLYSLKEYILYIFKYRKELVGNEKYRDMYKGKRCFVLGNGPSLKEQDLSKLAGEYVITVNSMSSTMEFNQIKPIFHVIVDYLRFDKSLPDLYANVEKLKELKHKPTFVFPVEMKEFLDENGLIENLDVMYVRRKSHASRIFDIDFANRVPFYGNVVNTALYLAVYLGFSEIYLLGCDMTNIVKVFDEDGEYADPRYFYANAVKSAEMKQIRKLLDNDCNENRLSTYWIVFKLFRFTNDYANRIGVKIFNATKGGTLDVFPRVKYESLFKK